MGVVASVAQWTVGQLGTSSVGALIGTFIVGPWVAAHTVGAAAEGCLRSPTQDIEQAVQYICGLKLDGLQPVADVVVVEQLPIYLVQIACGIAGWVLGFVAFNLLTRVSEAQGAAAAEDDTSTDASG